MLNELHKRAIAFLKKTKKRGMNYSLCTAKYYLRRSRYFIINKIKKYISYAPMSAVYFKLTVGHEIQNLDLEYFRKREYPRFLFDIGDVDKIIGSVPENLKKEVISKADDILEMKFNFRGIKKHIFNSEIDWNFAANNVTTWQWDLNRHAYFLDLMQAYFFSGKTKYIEHLIYIWEHWIDKNPPAESPNWQYPFEVATRLNNWIWCFFMLVYSNYNSRYNISKILESLFLHADYIYNNLELNWPNNHLFLEAKALFEFAFLVPELDRNKRFFRRSKKILIEQVQEQITEDGCHSELCSMYHMIVAGEIKEIYFLLMRNLLQLDVLDIKKVSDVMDLSDAITRDDGSIPLLGDSAATDNNIRFSSSPKIKTVMDHWLPDKGMIASRSTGDREGELCLKCFTHAGYAVIDENSARRKCHLVFDFGDFSKNPASDHAHCDALSFELWLNGKSLIVDPGIYFSGTDKFRWHRYFRSTAAHNTLVIDDMEQSDLWRASDVGETAVTRLVKAATELNRIEIEAMCKPFFCKSVNGIHHTRRLVYEKSDDLCIADYIDGKSTHKLQWFFHFASGIDVSIRNGAVIAIDDKGNTLLKMIYGAAEELYVEIAEGEMSPLKGWYSDSSFQVKPIQTVVYRAKASLPFYCQFKLHIL